MVDYIVSGRQGVARQRRRQTARGVIMTLHYLKMLAFNLKFPDKHRDEAHVTPSSHVGKSLLLNVLYPCGHVAHFPEECGR